MVIFAVTDHESRIPNPQAALDAANSRYTWYCIESIERVGILPVAWDRDDAMFQRLSEHISQPAVDLRFGA
jgi:hypothetical protein